MRMSLRSTQITTVQPFHHGCMSKHPERSPTFLAFSIAAPRSGMLDADP